MKSGKKKRAESDPLKEADRLMREAGMPPLAIEAFSRNYAKLVSGEKLLIEEDDISPVESLPSLSELDTYEAKGQEALPETVVFKLNGGLGTSMGLNKAKSLLPAKDGQTFLDIIIGQIVHLRRRSGSRLPLLLMNSFSTDEDTQDLLNQHEDFLPGQPQIPVSFLQHRIPKIHRETLQPVDSPEAPEKAWCPPGHGDFYTALTASGVLKQLLDEGFKYGFVSNADNLGASLDVSILGYIADRSCPFLMEVTERTEADKKGGHLARHETKGLLLRERAQCKDSDMSSFEDCEKHRFFNTNNLWINLEALARKLDESDGHIDLPLIANRKTLDPGDENSAPVYQLESAMGSAIGVFDNAEAVVVPRTRFAPVKTTNDLLALRSDIYLLDDESRVVVNPARADGQIVIDLDPEHYRLLADFESHFPKGAPSLVDCRRLTIKGKFTFDEGITLRGSIDLRNRTRHDILVPEGTLLQSSQ